MKRGEPLSGRGHAGPVLGAGSALIWGRSGPILGRSGPFRADFGPFRAVPGHSGLILCPFRADFVSVPVRSGPFRADFGPFWAVPSAAPDPPAVPILATRWRPPPARRLSVPSEMDFNLHLYIFTLSFTFLR